MNPAQLPLWAEYVKALGTPIVALIAACIAGTIAYRQWATARNKLKLDFFEKRVAIYRLALEALEAARSCNELNFKVFLELENSLYSARWLFNSEVEAYLRELGMRAYTINKSASKLGENLVEADFAAALTSLQGREDAYQQERINLDKIVAPFLSLEH